MKLKKLILIYPFLMMIIYGQTKHYISGYITDSNSEPLYGANVILTNTYSGSTTDSLGFYSIENLEAGKFTILVSYIGYKTKKKTIYISEYENNSNDFEDTDFSAKLGLDETDESSQNDIIKAPFYENFNFTLDLDVLETDQIVVSASKKKERLMDAPVTITLVSNNTIRRNISNDMGDVLKTTRGVEVYQAGMGRTAINVRGFMSAFNGRFVSLVDGGNYMEPTFFYILR